VNLRLGVVVDGDGGARSPAPSVIAHLTSARREFFPSRRRRRFLARRSTRPAPAAS